MANSPEQERYRAIYDQLNERLQVLTIRRDEAELSLGDLKKEISSLEETLTYLAPLSGYIFNPTNLGNVGITEAVRTVLNLEAPERISVSDLKKKMEDHGFSFESYSSPGATLHTVLRRLADAGEVKLEKDGYKVFYLPVQQEISDEDIPF